MKVVLAPDSFKESMSAAQAAAAMARGVREVLPDADCVEVPMADGGEGTTEALVDALAGQWRTVPSTDALRRPIDASYGLADDNLAIIEVAAAVGIGLIAPAERDVLRSDSRGVAALVLDALDSGATRLIVGLGGSATTDGGAGLLAGLGARWLDAAGHELAPDPNSLAAVHRVDLTGLDPRLADVTIDLACDVTNPLLGPRVPPRCSARRRVPVPNRCRCWTPTWPSSPTSWSPPAPLTSVTPRSRCRRWAGAAFLSLGARLRPASSGR